VRGIVRNPPCTLVAAALLAAGPALRGGEAETVRAGFFRSWWYEPGLEHGNPGFNRRFRVNSPGSVLDPRFRLRSEVRGNGMMLILIEEDLAALSGAELQLELWGGHPGTAGKRVTINGRSTYELPRNGVEEGHSTHSYPRLELKLTDLVNGYNALQFACEQGSSFWGHFIVDNAALRLALRDGHPDLENAGLAGFRAEVKGEAGPGEALHLRLETAGAAAGRIAEVHYSGRYTGYDENGDGRGTGWHGFTKERRPAGILGTAKEPPHALAWDLSMLPDQDEVAVRAAIRFEGLPALEYVTHPALFRLLPRRGSRVSLHGAAELPRPFWSRAGQTKSCEILLDRAPEEIEKAQLHVVLWDGGQGGVEHPFTLNGHPLAAAGEGRHDVLYRVLEIEPRLLRKGANRIALLSDTHHHGIEVLLPGPALVVRARER
jgi:hypothetical protein